jgi:ParB-like chromosome segregation protein Spo0J
MRATTLQVENLKLTDITPYKNNAKQHLPEQIEQIKKSIAEFGMNDPIAIDENNVVIEGHGRLLALKAMQASEVPCIRLSHLSEDEKKAYIIAHNKLTLNSGFDVNMLLEEFSFLQGADFNVQLTGFTQEELEDIFSATLKEEISDDNFDVEAELQKPVFSHAGDLWLLGRHRLSCGDSTKEAVFDLLMDGKKANLVVTDHPYNVNYEGAAGKIKNDNLGG